jgi:hypothetical protein
MVLFLLITLSLTVTVCRKLDMKFGHEPSLAHSPSKVSLACICDPNSLAMLATENFSCTGVIENLNTSLVLTYITVIEDPDTSLSNLSPLEKI